MSLPRQLPCTEPDEKLLTLFDQATNIPLAVRRGGDFFVFFATTVFPILENYRTRLDAMYCLNNGRPAWDPIRMLAVAILQFVTRTPDRQAAEAVQYDLRWRLALHLSQQDAAFDPSLLTVFRQRLLNSGEESLAFEAVLDFLVEHGWVAKRSRQRLDSTHVCGLLEHMSRLECVRKTLCGFLHDVERRGLLPESWSGYWDCYVESKVDPRSKAPALKAKFAKAGNDIRTIWVDCAGLKSLTNMDSFVLLQRVFLENYELEPAGVAKQRRAQPTGAVHNPHEPEAQWSSKSTTKDKTWIGYKTQAAETVREETCAPGEPTANFLTAIVTQDATASDKAGMSEVFTEQQRMGLEPPSTLYVDGAYVSSQALKDASDQGRELRGPAPRSPNRGKVFTVEAFDVHLEERYAICPAKNRSSNCSRLKARDTGKVDYRIEWNRSLCQSCPLLDQCVGPTQNHRTIVVGELHSFLQGRRLEMQTDAFKLEMHSRNGIEGTQSELIRAHGMRRARYRGKAKVRLQNYMIGTACNIRRLFRRIAWEAISANSDNLATTAALTG